MSLSVPVPPTGGREKEKMEGKVEIGILVFNLELKKSQNVTSYLCRPSVVPPAVLLRRRFVAEVPALCLTMPKVGGRGNPNTVCLYE